MSCVSNSSFVTVRFVVGIVGLFSEESIVTVVLLSLSISLVPPPERSEGGSNGRFIGRFG